MNAIKRHSAALPCGVASAINEVSEIETSGQDHNSSARYKALAEKASDYVNFCASNEYDLLNQ